MRLLIQVEVFGSAAASTQCNVKCLQGRGMMMEIVPSQHILGGVRSPEPAPAPLIIIIIQRKCEELDSV